MSAAGAGARHAVALIAVLVVCLAWRAAGAMRDLHVVALFKDRAVVVIDGNRHLLKAGETSPEGITLVSADSSGAVFEYQGRTLERRLDGRSRAAAPAPTTAQEHHIYRDTRGMYRTVGSINGLTVNFLVDTGASAIALNSQQARRLGIDYLVEGNSTFVTTASDVIRAYKVSLNVVRVGTIEQRNVDALVMEGPQPEEVLLGMSFMGPLDISNEGNRLVLRRRY
jgi:aspartyl protease family protein